MTLTFEQLPFLYQIETVECANWVGANVDNYKREALRIWEEEKYEPGNIHATQRRNEVESLFQRLLRYKRNWRFVDGVDQLYRNYRGGGRVHNVSQNQFEAWTEKNQQLQVQLAQLQKNNQELQKQLQAAMNELMGIDQVEEQTEPQSQAVQVQGNLPFPGGNK